MTDQEIKELVDTKLLKNIQDYAIQTVLRRVLYYNKNKIDWQDFYENMKEQMPELTIGESSVQETVNKILEGADVRTALSEMSESDLDLKRSIIRQAKRSGKSVKWDSLYDSEEDLIDDMMKTMSDPNLPRYKLIGGYEYINSFKKAINSGKQLSDAQMRQLKRLAVEVFKNVHGI